MASSTGSPDVWGWINNLPSMTQWKANPFSICICNLGSDQEKDSDHASLDLTIAENPQSQNSSFFFCLLANSNIPIPIPLWTSTNFSTKSKIPLAEEMVLQFFQNIVEGVLKYGPKKSCSLHNIPSVRPDEVKEIFNLAFLSLSFLVCVYEAPTYLHRDCLETLRFQLTTTQSREAMKLLLRRLGSNIEEQWMMSMNLAVTNCILELRTSNDYFKVPSSSFSYTISTTSLWKVQLYCPIIAMSKENPQCSTKDQRLLFSLRYQQLECVIQFAYKVNFREKGIDVLVKVDNIRCDVKPLLPQKLMAKQGLGSDEKHFPSRISLQLTPTLSNVMSVSVSKSSDNPALEVGVGRSLEGSFNPPNPYIGLRVSTSETVTRSLKPWKFEQTVHGDSANLDWFLHDTANGKEVFAAKPSKLQLFQPRAWFQYRYSSAYRLFTKQGGVIFAGDEYGENVWWKIDGEQLGQTMSWEIMGEIWLTYWPNKHNKFYSETRRLEFRELGSVQLVRQG